MEYKQDAIHFIQMENIACALKARDILIAGRGPVGMEGFVRCIETEDGVIVYPTAFGYIAVDATREWRKKVIIVEATIDWGNFPWQQMYNYLSDEPYTWSGLCIIK